MAKRAGRHSQSQNDFLQPNDVTITTATNVGTNRPYLAVATGTNGQGGAVNLVWTLPALSPAATSYDITSTPATVTKNTTTLPTGGAPFVFEGLASGVSYTFSVVAKNAAGNSNAVTSSSVAVTTVPQAPQSPALSSPSADSDRIAWTVGATGGSAITQTTLVPSLAPNTPIVIGVGSLANSGTPTSAVYYDTPVPGGTNEYFSLYATNANGNSATVTTNTISTTPPFFPPFFPPSFPPRFGIFSIDPSMMEEESEVEEDEE